MRASPFNEEQQDYMRYLASLPREARCPCGWYVREDCDKRPLNPGCADSRAKAGLPPHPSAKQD
jgi:hypothetical protein